MARDRKDLHKILVKILGSNNVYFNPPDNVRMSYPAIVYNLDDIDNQHADNNVYCQRKTYNVTVIDSNPDSKISEEISLLPIASFDRNFRADGLNHFSYLITY